MSEKGASMNLSRLPIGLRLRLLSRNAKQDGQNVDGAQESDMRKRKVQSESHTTSKNKKRPTDSDSESDVGDSDSDMDSSSNEIDKTEDKTRISKGQIRPSSQLQSNNVKLTSIEDEIAKLEQSLGNSDSDENEVSDDEDDQEEDEEDDEDQGKDQEDSNILVEIDKENDLKIEKSRDGKVVKLVSVLDDDRIAPLPKNLLPAAFCSSKSIREANGATSKTLEKPRTIRFADETPNMESTKNNSNNRNSKNNSKKSQQSESKLGRGMEMTVKELFANYKPTSAEHKPFFCRACSFQGNSIEEFQSHKQSESHFKCVAIERKASFCTLCKKQFNSPEQLKEHLGGKMHIERLETLKQRQATAKKFC